MQTTAPIASEGRLQRRENRRVGHVVDTEENPAAMTGLGGAVSVTAAEDSGVGVSEQNKSLLVCGLNSIFCVSLSRER